MSLRKRVWHMTSKLGIQMDSYYYYLRLMRLLENEIYLVNAISDRRGRAVDIGANYGIWSYHLSRIFKSVDAFEPIKECCEVIRNTKRKNITVHNEALSSGQGSLELKIPVDEEGELLLQSACLGDINGPYDSRVVPVKTLDDYGLMNTKFIKIDVEGHEIEVLKGAANTILRDKPSMIIEIEQRHLDYPMDNVFELVKSYGYKAYFLSGRRLRPYSEFSYEQDQMPYLDDLSSVAYIHNFVCLPENRR